LANPSEERCEEGSTLLGRRVLFSDIVVNIEIVVNIDIVVNKVR